MTRNYKSRGSPALVKKSQIIHIFRYTPSWFGLQFPLSLLDGIFCINIFYIFINNIPITSLALSRFIRISSCRLEGERNMHVNNCVKIHCFSAALELLANTSADRLEFCGNISIKIKQE